MDNHENENQHEADEALLRTLRSASEPKPDEGAAARIADGAWARAAALGTAPRRGFRVLGRGGLLVAAALLAGVSLFVLGGTDPVLAVEGDPVKVWKGKRWVADDDVDRDH